MNFLITAGPTHAPIDKARSVATAPATRVGGTLARTALGRGHKVTLLSSEPDGAGDGGEGATVVPFRTFDELANQFQALVKAGGVDAVCHAAASGDYLSAGVYVPEPGTSFNARTRQWETRGRSAALAEHKYALNDAPEPEVWVRLVRAPNLTDRVRSQWGFKGLLVKFATAAGMGDQELIE